MTTDWDGRFLALAEHIAGWSKDPSTQVGCVIARPDRSIASVGYNGLPRGVVDSHVRLNDRTTKYAMTVHSEPNAIVAANGPVRGCTIYTWPFPPCSSCAGLIIQAGIMRVVAPAVTSQLADRWGKSLGLSTEMLAEADVQLEVRDVR